ncbi:hypothetical protein AIN29_19035 [Salmonella enterica subsp. enterica serovar Newport]|uniref:hypothetical protein n=1 Tax=Felsduovirus Fels2 TaxID=194701 RepID=UPI00016DBA23|nr:hypothetical protein STM2733.1.Fels2 [Felsduovirus Fels2]PXV31680.1 hypothetical protein AIN29_19035 [Salmonella enterica subsp. enterica serovar Newport]
MQCFQFLCNQFRGQFIPSIKQFTVLTALYASTLGNNCGLPHKLNCCDYNNGQSEYPFQPGIGYDSSTANNLNSSHQFVSPTVKCRCHKLKVIAVMQLEIFGALFSHAGFLFFILPRFWLRCRGRTRQYMEVVRV